jgi:hypothetical protein
VGSCAGCSGDFLTPSPPAEKAAARQDQAGKASARDGAGNYRRIDGVQKYIAGVIGRGDIQELKTPRNRTSPQ